MVMTTMGSDYFPRTTQGRVLCFAHAVFGYVTATLATFFVGSLYPSAPAMSHS